MKVKVPKHLNRDTMHCLFIDVIGKNLKPMVNEVQFDFTELNSIEPSGVTILSNLFEWLQKNNVTTSIYVPKSPRGENKKALMFLDDSKFFIRYFGKNITPEPALGKTTIPLELVSVAESTQWTETTLINWLSVVLCERPNKLTTLCVCVREIFNNINDHAEEQIGCVFVQHYPELNTIKICISDFGIGIPGSIQKVHPSWDDCKCLLKATLQGFSSHSKPHNRGAGLDTLITNVVNNNFGEIHIHSSYGKISCSYDKAKKDVLKFAKPTTLYYPGTLLEIILKTDTITHILDEEEDFDGWD